MTDVASSASDSHSENTLDKTRRTKFPASLAGKLWAMNNGSSVSVLLDESEWALDHSMRVRERAAALQRAVRASLLTFRSHRFRPIFGASDAVEDNNRVRQFLRDCCSGNEPPKSYVGHSRGSVCQACGNVIKANDIEYDVATGTSELRLDAECYVFLIDRLAAASHDSPDAAND